MAFFRVTPPAFAAHSHTASLAQSTVVPVVTVVLTTKTKTQSAAHPPTHTVVASVQPKTAFCAIAGARALVSLAGADQVGGGAQLLENVKHTDGKIEKVWLPKMLLCLYSHII